MIGMTQHPDGSGSSLPRSWGPAPATRGLLWLVLVVCAGAVVLFMLWGLVLPPPDGDRPGSLAMAGMPAVCALLTWRFGLHPLVTATVEGITVRNPLGTRRLVWSEIRAIRAGYGGLAIHRTDGGVTTAWAVQQTNLSGWLRRRTRAHEVAAELTRLFELHGAG